MKAAVIREFGDAAVLKLEDVPTPKPRPGHVLVKVLAAGVTFDYDGVYGAITGPWTTRMFVEAVYRTLQ